MFVNRKNELVALENEYNKESSSFIVIYGRRRVGKTTLIREFIKDKKSIYYYATEINITMQLKSFTKDLLTFLGFSHINFDSFEDAFIFLSKNVGDKKLLLVIDEYQNLVKVDKSFSSMLQKIWDIYMQDTNIKLILCGSTISMMHSEVLNYSAPLYGRSTAIINLKPLFAKHIYDFVPNVSFEDFMKIYASFGTIPKYLQIYQKDMSFINNLKESMLNKNSFLYNEGYFLLKQEINDVSTYFSILEAISKGATKLGAISSMLGMNSSSITKYIEKLIALGYIEKEIPITEKNPLKSKAGRYKFKDNFLKFWFFYVYKNYRYLEIDLIDYVLKEIETNFNDNFVSFAFEDFIKEKIIQDPLQYLNFIPLKIGRWWNSKEEIDIVAFDENSIAFIECKWTNKVVTNSIVKELKRKSNIINSANKKKIYIIFSKNGCSDTIDSDVLCFR